MPAPDLEGRTILHYRILEKLGEGGMGTVYKAEDNRLKRIVALKFLSEPVRSDPTGRSRFFREAQAAARLDHPNICAVYDLEEFEGHYFIAMAYVEGPTLAAKMKQGMTLAEALDCAIAVGEGLQFAHSRGVVHRDIKPANILIGWQNTPRITDFGLARLEDRSRLTSPGTVMGTVTSMAPEQIMAEDADRRTDIWAFGVMLYEMLTGNPPFHRSNYKETMEAILHHTPPPPHKIDPRLPHEFAWVFEKLLAKARSERYQHLDDLLTDLRAIRRRLSPQQEALVLGAVAPADQPTVTAATGGSTQPALGIGWKALAFIAVLLAGIVVLLFVLRS